MRYTLIVSSCIFLASCTLTNPRLATVPLVVPIVAPAPSEFKMNVGAEGIPQPSTFELFGISTYRTLAHNGSLPPQKELTCAKPDGSTFACDENANPLTAPCSLTFKMPVLPNADGKWGVADFPISSAEPGCLCSKGACRGSAEVQLRDVATGATVPGPHTRARISWMETAAPGTMKVTWLN